MFRFVSAFSSTTKNNIPLFSIEIPALYVAPPSIPNAAEKYPIAFLLRELGFDNVHKTKNNAEAIIKLREFDYSCIIADVGMTPMPWPEFLVFLQRDDHFEKIPIMLISTDSRLTSVQMAMYLGVSSYLVRPFTIRDFQDKFIKLITPKS